jgi:hypothetical protein
MQAALKAMLIDTITHEPYVSHDQYGAPTYGASVTRPGRLETRMATAIVGGGLTLVPQTRLFLDGDPLVHQSDRLTLPDGTQMLIQNLAAVTDEQGVLSHYEIVF